MTSNPWPQPQCTIPIVLIQEICKTAHWRVVYTIAQTCRLLCDFVCRNFQTLKAISLMTLQNEKESRLEKALFDGEWVLFYLHFTHCGYSYVKEVSLRRRCTTTLFKTVYSALSFVLATDNSALHIFETRPPFHYVIDLYTNRKVDSTYGLKRMPAPSHLHLDVEKRLLFYIKKAMLKSMPFYENEEPQMPILKLKASKKIHTFALKRNKYSKLLQGMLITISGSVKPFSQQKSGRLAFGGGKFHMPKLRSGVIVDPHTNNFILFAYGDANLVLLDANDKLIAKVDFKFIMEDHKVIRKIFLFPSTFNRKYYVVLETAHKDTSHKEHHIAVIDFSNVV